MLLKKVRYGTAENGSSSLVEDKSLLILITYSIFRKKIYGPIDLKVFEMEPFLSVCGIAVW